MLVALAVLIPGVPVAIGVAIGAAARRRRHRHRDGRLHARRGRCRRRPRRPSRAPKPSSPAVPAGRARSSPASSPDDPARYSGRHGRSRAPAPRPSSGRRRRCWVVSHVPGWLGVVAPQAGNGRVGWIAQSAASLSRVSWELKVSLSTRGSSTVLDARQGRRALHGGDRAAGCADAHRALRGHRPAASPMTRRGPYGCCILALSAHAPHAIQGWSGGDRIAIHSTPDEREHRRGGQPRLRARDARRGALAARPHPARDPDADQQLTLAPAAGRHRHGCARTLLKYLLLLCLHL